MGGPANSAYTLIWKFMNDAFSNRMRLGYGAALCYLLFIIIMAFSFLSRRLSGKREGE